MKQWFKRIWNKIFHRKKESLRERFNKVRYCYTCSCGYPVSGSGDAEVDAYMEKLLKDVKKVPYLDVSGSCDDYNLRFNLALMVEDINIPIRSEVTGSL